jgi:hypothetical protein
MFTWLLAAALADDAAAPDHPLPIDAEPYDVRVVAYLVPPPDVAWITSEAPAFRCSLEVTYEPAGETGVGGVGATPSACPDVMVAPLSGATAGWRFEPVDPASKGPTKFAVHWVLRYTPTIGVMTLSAEVDPGEEAAFAGETGVPGVKLVREARPKKEVHPKLPKSAAKAGVAAGATCALHVTVDASGRVAAPAPAEAGCPEALMAAGTKAAKKWRFSPKVVDGLVEATDLDLVVTFR